MTDPKSWTRSTAMVILFALLLLPACDGVETPAPTAEPTLPPTLPSDVAPPVVTIKQELDEQFTMLRALVEAEKGRGKDVAQAEQWLQEAEQALQSDDWDLARQKLREAGAALGVKLP